MRSLRVGAFLLLAATVAGDSFAREPAGTTWYVILTEGGAPFGYGTREIADGPNGREITDTQQVDVREQGGRWNRMLARTVTKEDAADHTFFISSYSEAGRMWSRAEASIANGRADITRSTPADKRTVSVALPANVRFDTGDGIVDEWDPAKTPRLEFDNFDVDGMVVEHVVIEAAPGAPTDAEGRRVALRRRYEGGELRSVVRLLLNSEHRIVEVSQPLFGTTIIVREADRETALKPHPPYRVIPTVMTKSPFLISREAIDGHIRYRFAFRDGMRFDLPQTGEQRVRMEGNVAVVDVCETCGPGLPADPQTLAEALKPTVWLQSDDQRIKDIVASVASLSSNARKMELLAQKTNSLVGRVDFAGHFSALEALQRRAGDCTETSVLLAALGRAAGIPTRVVNGLVYSRQRYHGVSNAFLPHSWTIAFVDGKWRSFDGALFAFDATHIALNLSDGDARSVYSAGQLASLLIWDSMSEIRTRPAN